MQPSSPSRALFPTPVLALVLVAGLIVAATPGQTAYISYPSLGIADRVLPNDACGPTYPQIDSFASTGCGFGTPFLQGGLALDQTTNVVFETNGSVIFATPSPLYALGPCPVFAGFFASCGIPVPNFPGTFGPATGMAIEPDCLPGGTAPLQSTLWITDGAQIESVNTATGAVIGGPWVVTPLPPGTLLTGLEFDWAAGDLIACSLNGVSYRVSVTGGSQGNVTGTIPPSAAYLAAGSPPVTSNIFDRGAGAAGAYYICDGPWIYPVAGQYASLPPFLSGVSSADGASFSAEPVLLRSGCSCFGAQIFTSQPVVCGLFPSFDIGIRTSPPLPGLLAFLLVSFDCCAYPLPFLTNCTIWTCPTTAVLLGPFLTDGAGQAVGFSAGTLPCFIGFTAYAQWAYICASQPGGFAMTDAMHMRVSWP